MKPPHTEVQRLCRELLLVEDDAADVELIRECLCGARVGVNLSVVENGARALDYLHRRDGYAKATRPDLIVLDLNLPVKDGRAVLSEIKEDVKLSSIPVLVFTTSDASQDILRSYSLGANCYVTKPLELDEFERVIRCIEEFWLSTARLPNQEGAA